MSETIILESLDVILQALGAILGNMDTMRTYIQALASMIAVVIGMQALMLIWISGVNREVKATIKKLNDMYDALKIEDVEIPPP